MEERRKKLFTFPFLTSFQIVLVIVIVALLLSLIILYYSFTKGLEKPLSSPTRTTKINKFLDLHADQIAQIKDKTQLSLNTENIYYLIAAKILSLGNNFKQKCYEMASDGSNIFFLEENYRKTKSFHLGIFKITNILVLSNTTHFFDIPLKDQKKKVYHQLIAADKAQRPYMIHYFQSPNFNIQERRTSINFCGIFYRLVKYENIEGKEVVAPLFLTYTLEKFTLPRHDKSVLNTIAILLVVGAIFVLFFLRHKAKMKQLEWEIRNHKKKI